MTFDEWVATERHHNDISEVESAFGFTPEGDGWEIKEVVSFRPGTAVILDGGDWYSHAIRSEMRGTADEVRRFLWEAYAKDEVG